MESDIPKVLHTIAGKPMIKYILKTVKSIKPDIINIVYGHGGNLLKSIIHDPSIIWIFQKKQLGTGHAIKQVIPQFSAQEDILIVYGDIPLISIKTLKKLYKKKPKEGICLLTKKLKNPNGYGRILRDINNKVFKVVESQDANSEELLIKEVNTGIFIANSSDLQRWIKKITNKNTQGEFYLTNIIELAYKEGIKINTIYPIYKNETKGVNNLLQLSYIEKIYQADLTKKLLLSGLKLKDPSRFDIRGTIEHGKNVFIDINVVIKGKVKLGNNVRIGIGCILKDSIVGDNCFIKPYSIIENSELLDNCIIGPFAIILHKSKLESGVKIGNFVEIKKSNIGQKSKARHLSYIGDAKIGKKVNIGAGTITCNFNGINKNNTIIGDNVFIGSTTQLIAPINISNNVTVAAGTTVMKSVASSNLLVYNPKKQIHKSNWKGPKNKK